MHDSASLLVKTLSWDVWLSALRWAIGLTTGALLALLVALAYESATRSVRSCLGYLVDFVRAIPILAVVPFVAWWLGPREAGKIFIIALASGAIICQFILERLREPFVDLRLRIAGAGLRRRCRLRIYEIPRITFYLSGGMKLAIGVAWISVVAAEMTGTYRAGFWGGGLGYRLQVWYEDSNWTGMLLGIAIFGAIGLVSSKTANGLPRLIGYWTSIKL